MLTTTEAITARASRFSSRSLGALAAAAALAASAAFSTGCTVEDGTTDEQAATSEDALTSNRKAAYEYFVAKGLTSYQAAGIVGNLLQESGLSPTIKQFGGGPGRGIAQWSAGGRWDTDGGDNAVWYAHTHGKSVYSLNLQLDFIWYELTHFSAYGLSHLKAATNVTEATIVFQGRFEGCGACDESQRIAFAKQVLAAYGH